MVRMYMKGKANKRIDRPNVQFDHAKLSFEPFATRVQILRSSYCEKKISTQPQPEESNEGLSPLE